MSLRFTLSERLCLALLTIFVLIIAAWPLARLAFEALFPGGNFSLGPLLDVLGSNSTWRATRNSLVTSFAGMIGAVLIGALFAFLVALTDIRAKMPLVFCFMLPMMIPPQVTALSWIQIFGPSSTLLLSLGLAPAPGSQNPIYSPGGIILLLSVQHAPLAFLILRAGLRQIPRELVEAARLSGANGLTLTRTIIAPLLLPSLCAAAGLSFVSALGNFGIPAMLGIPASYYVLPTLIYRRLTSFGPDIISDAAILAVIVGMIGLIAVFAQNRIGASMHTKLTSKPGAPLRTPLGPWRLLIETGLWAIIALILILPLSALAVTSLIPTYGMALTPASLTWSNYGEVLLRQTATLSALENSLFLASVSALVLCFLAIPLGYFVVWRKSRSARRLATLAEAPYALPGVVLSIAIILTYLKPLPLIGVSLYGTLGIIFIAYLARFLALALKPVLAGFEQLDPKMDEAARIAGASFIARLRFIAAPLLGPVAMTGGILVFMTAVNELTVSALLWSSGNETLGVLIYNLEDSGSAVLASALAMVTVAMVLGLMCVAQAFSQFLPAGVLPWDDKHSKAPAKTRLPPAPNSSQSIN